MIYLAQGEYLLLLLIIPFLFIFYGVSLRIKKKRIARLGDTALVSKLMPDVSRGRGWLKITLLALAWFFFVLGLVRPQLGARLKERESKGVEVMVALDISNSMLAEDYSPNRLERSKLAIERLVDRLHGDRIGLILFAGQSFVQLPITTDYVSAKIFLNSITPGSVPIQGTALADAIATAARSFSTQSENSRAIIVISDGEDHEGDVMEVARTVAESGIKIYCIGVGSPEGKPIPMNGGLLKDKNGEIVVTRLDENTLRRIAGIGEGIYVRAGNSEFGLNPIIDHIREMDKQEFQSVVFEDFDEQYMYFFGIALFFLILELLISEKKSRRQLFKMEEK